MSFNSVNKTSCKTRWRCWLQKQGYHIIMLIH